ncbi:MAG TPA: hypothetical protein VE993_11100 [Stellaceae bacterium]|nr:hypothetical protein [Stellaceae bacterium]
MQRFCLVALLAALLAGCADYIPVKDGFGTSALRRAGKTPPEYAQFNNYDPGVNALLTHQICATPYVLLEQKIEPAVPGELIAWRGPCQPYVITRYNWPEHLLPSRPLVAWRPPVTPWPPPPFPWPSRPVAPPPPAAAPPAPTPLLPPAAPSG